MDVIAWVRTSSEIGLNIQYEKYYPSISAFWSSSSKCIMASFLIYCPISVQILSPSIPGICLQPVSRNQGNFCICVTLYDHPLHVWKRPWNSDSICAVQSLMTAVPPSLLVNGHRQQETEMGELQQLPVSLLCSRFKNLVLGTFKFTKCVVCMITADFLKNLSLPLWLLLHYTSLTHFYSVNVLCSGF